MCAKAPSTDLSSTVVGQISQDQSSSIIAIDLSNLTARKNGFGASDLAIMSSFWHECDKLDLEQLLPRQKLRYDQLLKDFWSTMLQALPERLQVRCSSSAWRTCPARSWMRSLPQIGNASHTTRKPTMTMMMLLLQPTTVSKTVTVSI